MKKIPVSCGQLTLYALVDDSDYGWLKNWKWHAINNIYTFYAVRGDRKAKRQVSMHREILMAKTGQLVDHRNGDGLDNRKKNIWVCSRSENNLNRRIPLKNLTAKQVSKVYQLLPSERVNWLEKIGKIVPKKRKPYPFKYKGR